MSDSTINTHPLASYVRRGGIAILVLGALGTVGAIWVRKAGHAQEAARLKKKAEAGPLLRTLVMGAAGTVGTPTVQGEALPFQSTTLYARASGFLKEIPVDKGSVVRKGQLLAVLEGMEVELDLDALKADADNRRRNAQRAEALFRQGLISAKDAEQAQADAKVTQAKVASLGVSRGYQEIRAPFDGVVVQRFVDPGAVVQNASSSTNAQPLVTVAQVARLRITAYLDQAMARKAKPGMPVRVIPEGDKGEPVPAKLSRVAGALDPRTRTLLVEVDLDNREGRFLPGGAVKLMLGTPGEAAFMLPMEAVVQRTGKPHALVVDGQNRAQWKPLMLGEDNGQRVRVLQGLAAGDRVALNPPAGLLEGAIVRVVDPAVK